MEEKKIIIYVFRIMSHYPLFILLHQDLKIFNSDWDFKSTWINAGKIFIILFSYNFKLNIHHKFIFGLEKSVNLPIHKSLLKGSKNILLTIIFIDKPPLGCLSIHKSMKIFTFSCKIKLLLRVDIHG